MAYAVQVKSAIMHRRGCRAWVRCLALYGMDVRECSCRCICSGVMCTHVWGSVHRVVGHVAGRGGDYRNVVVMSLFVWRVGGCRGACKHSSICIVLVGAGIHVL